MSVIDRPFWTTKIEEAWRKRNIIWLSGVRRAGKTSLCRSLKDSEYFDCELPSVRRQLEDPEYFLSQHQGRRLILDEVQRLQNPSELLKICADHYPDIFIAATGSSTLGAGKKFKDTLTGRKINIHLTPVLIEELAAFGSNLDERLLKGGLPPFLLSKEKSEEFRLEWVDSFWAKDIQELFRLENKSSFQKFFRVSLFAKWGNVRGD